MTDIDLEQLILCYSLYTGTIPFRSELLACLRELQERRAADTSTGVEP
jgi:hypothetical protein